MAETLNNLSQKLQDASIKKCKNTDYFDRFLWPLEVG